MQSRGGGGGGTGGILDRFYLQTAHRETGKHLELGGGGGDGGS